jgi:hypothetical protein
MRLRALMSIVLLISMLELSSQASWASAPKSGATCSKLKITKIFNGKKYTCIKNGKRLVWDKGTTLKPVLSTPTPTPTPTPTRFSSTGAAVASEVTKSFSSFSTKSPRLVIHYSPTTDRNNPIVLKNIQDSYRSISYWENLGVNFRENISIIFITEKDQEWWRQLKTDLGSSEMEIDRTLFSNFLKQPLMGYAGIGSKVNKLNSPFHILFFLASNLTLERNIYWAKTMAPHEFAHVVQYVLMDEGGGFGKFDRQACWFIEGLARFYERATQFSELYEGKFSYDEMKAMQLTYFDYIIPRETTYPEVKLWNKETYLTFLTSTQYRNESNTCAKTGYGYSIGWPLSEKFYIDFGPKAFVDLLVDLKRTADWGISFKNITGVEHKIWLHESGIPYLVGTP